MSVTGRSMNRSMMISWRRRTTSGCDRSQRQPGSRQKTRSLIWHRATDFQSWWQGSGCSHHLPSTTRNTWTRPSRTLWRAAQTTTRRSGKSSPRWRTAGWGLWITLPGIRTGQTWQHAEPSLRAWTRSRHRSVSTTQKNSIQSILKCPGTHVRDQITRHGRAGCSAGRN